MCFTTTTTIPSLTTADKKSLLSPNYLIAGEGRVNGEEMKI